MVTDHMAELRRLDLGLWWKTAALECFLDTLDSGLFLGYAVRYKTEQPYMQYVLIRRRPSSMSTSVLPLPADLKVGVPGDWESLETWLRKKVDSTLASLAMQQDWWARNGKLFRFMVLPPELRLKVYEQIIGPYIWPHYHDLHSSPPPAR